MSNYVDIPRSMFSLIALASLSLSRARLLADARGGTGEFMQTHIFLKRSTSHPRLIFCLPGPPFVCVNWRVGSSIRGRISRRTLSILQKPFTTERPAISLRALARANVERIVGLRSHAISRPRSEPKQDFPLSRE